MSRIHAALVLCALTIAACTERGPAERAGEAIDEGAEDVADAARDLRDEAEDLADELSDDIEEAR